MRDIPCLNTNEGFKMKVNVVNKKDLTADQEEVLERFMDFQDAMIEKDFEKLNEIICDNYTLTHMSGKTQTKEEFIDEIMDGTLNYYKSTIDNPDQILSYHDAATMTVPVPKYFYMCLLAVKNNQYKAIGFWTEHVNVAESYDYTHYARSIKEIEQLTGIDFFANLPDKTEISIENAYAESAWK